jgi:hypothetical protein
MVSIRDVKEATGIFERYSHLKEIRGREDRFRIGIKINDIWYSIYDSKENIEKILQPLEIGCKVKVCFTTSIYQDKEAFAVVKLERIDDDLTSPPTAHTTIPNDDKNKVVNVLLAWKEDINHLLKQLGEDERLVL